MESKRRNPSYGCLRIAQQINLSFGINIDKDTVRRILAVHFPREFGGGGPSWLTLLGHTKDSFWSVDLFRCECILLIERLIGTIRREYLDQLFFWNIQDLERKLTHFAHYYNQDRTHQSHNGITSEAVCNDTQFRSALLERYA